ncbi:MAG: HAMP domain-containing protein [Phycisphaerae bacterium]|nr:HAMP domain-containing protein [Phycisphaerae bacterium]
MRVSLAVKYRILFGLAVILIIGAALCVPWYRMENLVLEQPFRMAGRVADDHFRLALPEPHLLSAAQGGVHGEGFGQSSAMPRPAVRFIARPPLAESLETDASQSSGLGPFEIRAFLKFIKRPTLSFVSETQDTDDEQHHVYAYAVRVTSGCLRCHDEGKTARTIYRENELAGIITVDVPADVSSMGLVWNRLLIIAAGAMAGILAILVFYVITHRFILAPIEELRGVATKVAEGDLDVRSNLMTGDEFEQLADSLNTMLERLRASQMDLKAANQLLDQKLGEMAETNVALYEANRIKSEFLANVSHELRTPLTSIIGFAELLREGPQPPSSEKATRYAENILISGRILLEIINDLLDLAKIEAGKVELHIDAVNVGELCATLIDFCRPQADEKDLRLELDTQEGLPTLATDRGRLRQILFNLLSNALKFTPEGGCVRLRTLAVGDERVRVEVIDTGPGIAKDHQEIIFEKFRQIDQSATREHHGTGLGLAIARELTMLLGGEISVTSELGRGSTFAVEFPTKAPDPRDRPLISLV